MKREHLGILLLPFTLALAAGLELALVQPPAPLPADAPPNVFSASRAARHLEAIAREPHPTGTPANARVRDHLVAELGTLGFATEVQRAAVTDRHGDSPTAGFAWVENVVGVRPGRGGGPALALMAHYDSRWNAPGAGDDGAGVATVLETARALGSTPLERDLVVLFTDGEEAGLLGAQAFFGGHPLGKRIGLALNFEARGSRGNALMFETSGGNAALIAGLAAAVPRPSATSLDYEAYRLMPNDTDLSVVKAAGLPGMNVALIGGYFDYHSPTDTAGNFSRATLQHMGEYALALARRFGNAPLPPAATGDAVYFDVFGRALVRYPAGAGHLLTLFAALGYAALARRAARGGRATARGIARGTLEFVAIVGAVVLLAGGLFALLGGTDDSRDPRFWWNAARLDLQALAYALLALGAAAFALHLSGARSGRAWELALGALGAWLLLALAASAVAPSASFAFNLPLLAALAAHHWALGRDPSDPRGDGALLLGALWGFLWLANLTYLVHLALGYARPALPAALPALALGLVVPLIARGPARAVRGAATAIALVGVGLLVWHAATPPWSARHPRPGDLWLLADLDVGETLFASRDRRRAPWQLAHVPEGAAQDSLARLLPGAEEPVWIAPASPMAATAATAPTMEVIEDRRQDGARELTLRHRPAAGAARGVLLFKSERRITELRIDGLAIATGERGIDGWLRVNWHAIPEAGVELALRLDGDADLELRVLSIGKGFAAPHSTVPEARPADAMVRHYGYGDATVIKKSFRF